MATKKDPAPSRSNFQSISQSSVPRSRNGKHHGIVGKVLSDLDLLRSGEAIKIPLDALDDTKANVRSALNRATRKQGLRVKTASDEKFLYIWSAAD